MAGDVRKVTLLLTANNAQLMKALDEAGIKADTTSTAMGDKLDKASSKAGQGFAKLGSAIESVTGIPVGAKFEEMGQKFDDASTKGKGLTEALQTLGTAGAGALAIGVAAAAYEFAKWGETLTQAQVAAKTAIDDSGASFDAWKPKIDATAKSLENLGFDNATFYQALDTSVIATQNVGKSLQQMTLAADVATVKHINLAQAALLLAKAEEGNSRVLKQLGIDLPVVSTNAEKLKTAQEALRQSTANLNLFVLAYGDHLSTQSKLYPEYLKLLDAHKTAQDKVTQSEDASSQILDALSKRMSGQAAAAAGTLDGKVKVLDARFTDFGANIGQKITHDLEELGGGLNTVIDAVSKLDGWMNTAKKDIDGFTHSISSATFGSFANTIDSIAGKIANLAHAIASVGNPLSTLANLNPLSLFNDITGKADGGPISAGTPYIVGERGPELIIPNSSGTVIPNHQLFGPASRSGDSPIVSGGQTINVYVTGSNATPTQIANELGWHLRTKVAA